MAVTIFGRFQENKSTTSITYKKYEETAEDKYPSFSICMIGPKLHSYNDTAIFDSYKITSDQYNLMLEGKETFTYHYNPVSRLYTKSTTRLNLASNVKFTSIVNRAFQIKDILLRTEFVREDGTRRTYHGKQSGQNEVEQPPLYISNEKPGFVCFTRRSEYISKSPRTYDILFFNLQAMQGNVFKDVEIQIFIHYPGQLWRSLDTPSFTSSISNYKGDKNLLLKLSQGTVLRYRPDSNAPCNEEIKDYDSYLEGHISNETGCIYPFWNTHPKESLNLGECASPEEMQNVSLRMRKYKKKSCVDMFKSVTWNWVDKEGPDDANIKFEYIDDYYQEIEYLAYFDGESLISNLGGFIGIFLGYSLMQVPELLGKSSKKQV